ARRVGIRHGAARFRQTPARTRHRRSGVERHARERARRVSDGVWRRRRARPAADARIGRRCGADDPVLSRAADGARHGRIRPQRSIPAVVHRGAPDRVHPDVRPLMVRAPTIRSLVLLTIVAVGAIALFRMRRPADANADVSSPRLAWIATAHQLGPVGYRDPAGAISPDGKWIAYSEGRFLRVQPVDGGPVVDLPPGGAQIRNLSWH